MTINQARGGGMLATIQAPFLRRISRRSISGLFTVALCLTLLMGCAGSKVRELMPTPTLLQGPAGYALFQKTPSVRRKDAVDLLYITDRAPDATPEAPLPYGQERSYSLGFGTARVDLLPPMDWPELTRHSLAHPRAQRIVLELASVKELGRYPTEAYPVQRVDGGVIRDPQTLAAHERAEAAMQAEVARLLREAPSKQIILYVHGFNETFATAAYTAAELCHFFGRSHVCAFFTWPASSKGAPLISYASTTESGQYSVGHLRKVIRALAATPGVEGIQLLAHSRGTAVMLAAVRELSIEAIAAGEAPAQAFKLENLVLMSPDIDAEVASEQLQIFSSDPGLTTRWRGERMPRFLRGRLTVYASPRDRALALADLLFRSRYRVGQLTPDSISEPFQAYFETLGNVDIVVNENKRTDFFGHSYFTSNPDVSADLIELIRNGTPPGAPGRPLIRADRITWVFPRRES